MRRIRRRRLRDGFTLLELMIVLALIAILAALGITQLSELIPRFRARKAASTFAQHVEEARQLAILHNRQTQLAVTDWDTSTSDPSSYGGGWQLAVGNRSVGSTNYDVLPFEEGLGDSYTGEGTFSISQGGNLQARGVSVAQPTITALTFNPRGWLDNANGNFAGLGYISFTFVNEIAAANGVDDSYEVRVFRGGMVRVVPSLGAEDNSTAGYDANSSTSSTAPSGS